MEPADWQEDLLWLARASEIDEFLDRFLRFE
jgi:hypothetical protein